MMTGALTRARARDGLPRVRDGNAEARIQAAICSYIRTVAPHVQCFHIPNGGLRGKAEAARLKWQGVLPGVPDLIIWCPGGLAYGLEIKAPGGVLSSDQRAFRDWCLENGVPHKVARSIEDAREALAEWRIVSRESA